MLSNMCLILILICETFFSHENVPFYFSCSWFLSLALLLLESKSRWYSFSQSTRNQSSLFINFSKWIVMIFSQQFIEIDTMCFIYLNQSSYTGPEKKFLIKYILANSSNYLDKRWMKKKSYRIYEYRVKEFLYFGQICIFIEDKARDGK